MSAPHAKRLKNRKVLLMGRSGAGKSSMRSIVFSNYIARDVRRLGATIDVEHSNIRFLNNLTLNLWDCGGQDGFMENYLEQRREEVFANVAVCVYVFDVESTAFREDLLAFERVCEALGEFNKPAVTARAAAAGKGTTQGQEQGGCRVWVCVHKMDLVQGSGARGGSSSGGGSSNIGEDGKPSTLTPGEKKFQEKCTEIEKFAAVFSDTIEFFGTSIWDQSLYRAWTRIIYHLIPNAVAIEGMLRRLTQIMGARECVLFERTTCLTVSSVVGEEDSEEENPNSGRGEVMSGVLKTWKQSLARHTRAPASSAHFADYTLKTSRFFFFITRLTENINLAAVLPPSEQLFNAAKTNVVLARPRFMELDVASRPRGGVGGNARGFMEGAARDVKVREGGKGVAEA